MPLESIADIKLTGRALVAGWLTGFEERRRKAVEALLDVVENNSDPELKRQAFEALVKADQADLKREELELKKQEADDNKRLRLLDILGRLPPGELATLASGGKGDAEG
jgi:hypothetical protein